MPIVLQLMQQHKFQFFSAQTVVLKIRHQMEGQIDAGFEKSCQHRRLQKGSAVQGKESADLHLGQAVFVHITDGMALNGQVRQLFSRRGRTRRLPVMMLTTRLARKKRRVKSAMSVLLFFGVFGKETAEAVDVLFR